MKRRVYIPAGCDQQGRQRDGQWIEFEDDQPPGEPFKQIDGLWLLLVLSLSLGIALGALLYVTGYL